MSQSFSITAKGVVYVEINLLANGERPYKTVKAFERAWEKFNAWLPKAHPELVGSSLDPKDYGKLTPLFREWQEATR